ncbi:hypothetical protein pdam_00018826 [Pocillopora damicornis]|uniref:G-protein coupled receptors family 1 profile domain-containing protein n=1 Tax=Pocillopora damicornis TaxID=46731 RepID=A0A3M6TGG1_POCDA|nr:hypothetical protein pdam_00018826 [Pocillopora damicornis]
MMTSKFEANYSSNTDANPKSGFETIVMANCILNAPLMLLSILGNALVLVAILRTPSIHSPSVIFLCNLAVTDLLVGLVVQPAYIAQQIVRTVSALQDAVTAMGFAGCGVSLWTMTAITVDRFLALHCHLQYPNLRTTSRAIYTIVTIWCIIMLFTFSFIWSPSIYHYFVATFGITICLLVNLVCFIKIYRIVRFTSIDLKVVATFSLTVVLMNSSINPFLFCWRMTELRAAREAMQGEAKLNQKKLLYNNLLSFVF